MIPTGILGGVGGVLLRTATTVLLNSQKDKQERRMARAANNRKMDAFDRGSVKEARQHNSVWANIFRLLFLAGLLFATAYAPFIISQLPDVNITMAYKEIVPGFLWLDDYEKMKFKEISGFIILAEYAEAFALFAGFLLGPRSRA